MTARSVRAALQAEGLSQDPREEVYPPQVGPSRRVVRAKVDHAYARGPGLGLQRGHEGLPDPPSLAVRPDGQGMKLPGVTAIPGQGADEADEFALDRRQQTGGIGREVPHLLRGRLQGGVAVRGTETGSQNGHGLGQALGRDGATLPGSLAQRCDYHVRWFALQSVSPQVRPKARLGAHPVEFLVRRAVPCCRMALGPNSRGPGKAMSVTASKRRTPLLAAGLTLLLLLPVGASSGGCLRPPGLAQVDEGTGGETPAADGGETPSRPPILIGIEYATPGLAQPFAALGVPAVKGFPELISWEKMQPAGGSSIDFRPSDRFVREYQAAGFTELVLTLKSRSRWASKDYLTNYRPKDEYLDLYEAWVGGVVERYDADGLEDMPGLKWPVRFLEIGAEFSSYEPEPVADYLVMLERAYRAAHAASDNVIVLNAAFLATTAFRDHPASGGYPAAFAAVDPRIMTHSLADIRAVLDRPDLFDAVDFHALGDALEIEDTVAWLRYEMSRRGYDKPIVIGDTAPSPLAGWGPATVTGRPPLAMAIIVPPAREEDRSRLAAHFTKVIGGDPVALAWTETYVAADMVKKVVVAADQGVLLIDTAFMEGFAPAKSKLFAASAGTGAWSEMATTEIKGLGGERAVAAYHPLFFALKQLAGLMKSYENLGWVEVDESSSVRLYRWASAGGETVWMVWLEPARLGLPDEPAPEATVLLEVEDIGATALVLPMATGPDGAESASTQIKVENGAVQLTVTPVPVYIRGGP